MNTNGILLTARAYNTLSTAATPCNFCIQIGKGLKGKSIDAFLSAARATPIFTDATNPGASATEYGTYVTYDERLGILTLDAGVSAANNTTRALGLRIDNGASAASGYFVVSASKNPALTGLNISAVAADYTSTAGQAVGTGDTLITYETKVSDTHGAYSSGVYTIQESGKYVIAASYATGTSVTITTTQSTQIKIFKNGSEFRTSYVRGNGASTTYHVQVSRAVDLVKGDTISIYGVSSVASTLSTTAAYNTFSITKTSVG